MARASYVALLVAGTREFRYEWKALLGIAGDNVTSWIGENEKRPIQFAFVGIWLKLKMIEFDSSSIFDTKYIYS